ncbi:MAG: exsB protein [Candidatus Collierbacteria bacterium GW2011_GWB1_45_35]|uniref:7-cyano-7-deazaguanine synthase n=1 Tax=Candidatus Collierbacteria bacterium GW2011_GWB2_45_17 TaxID=1618388 RepID=A0A837IJP1_9BACT|nr:MAG: exsB protein [Microgenomates group bacterium GW2011_GWC1_44_23]KKT96285.1 MAG: exsB protein [Candidatus Collierbacteria bacterium GW2011_GWA1_45_15]KKU01325.1 MAG: exsB protein [Candidatus Collierbacteria bacterium GW2011_GWB2_45_17]KKU05028.1 MAG: exsB protein [Candidatus Collierbacteria bacterium GW2011_GWB1_45_35]HCX25785.1 hypothetical protein [Candidatus Collierbacteria bacterium]
MKKSTFPIRVFSNRDEDSKILEMMNNIFLYRRGYISKVPKNEDVVFIFSGGLDSSITLDMIINEWGVNVFPLFVRRSARATKFEEESVRFFVDFYQKKYPGRMQNLEVVEIEVPPLPFKKYPEVDRLKKLGHPMRNAVLQSLGVQYAQKLRATVSPKLNTVLTATVGDDSFPHSSLQALRSVNLGVCIDTGDWGWQVTSPLVDVVYEGRPLFKKDLIGYAIKHNLPLDKTRTCIEGGEKPDGTCPECLCRLRAFEAAGVIDPLDYQNQ